MLSRSLSSGAHSRDPLARNDGESLAIFRIDIPPTRRMRSDILDAVFKMHALVRGQLLDDAYAGPPLGRGPDRPRHEATAAVRADIVQLGVDAIRAERAFVGANPRLRRVRRQILVAIFAVRPKLQRHGRLVR